jgi:hypothetical protein
MSVVQLAESHRREVRNLVLASWWVCIALVIYLSLKPDLELGVCVAGIEWNPSEAFHALAYSVLMLHPVLLFARRSHLWFALGFVSMGIAIEFIQPSFGRHFRYGDMAVDAIGVGIGLLAGAAAKPRLQKLLGL